MIDGVGKYGGTLRTTILANGDQYNLTRTIANELLVRWDPQWKKVMPSLAEEFKASEDATTYTFKLRKGLKVERRSAVHGRRHHVLVRRRVHEQRALARQEPDFHGGRQAGEGHQDRRPDGRVQVRIALTASSCSSSPMARAICRSSIPSIISAVPREVQQGRHSGAAEGQSGRGRLGGAVQFQGLADLPAALLAEPRAADPQSLGADRSLCRQRARGRDPQSLLLEGRSRPETSFPTSTASPGRSSTTRSSWRSR